MKTCATCRHWQPADDYDGKEICSPVDPDTFEPMPVSFEVRRCGSPHLLFYERPPESRQATLTDGSRYRASLFTGQDFGCVNHERLP